MNRPDKCELLQQAKLFDNEVIEIAKSFRFPESDVALAAKEVVAKDIADELVNESVLKDNLTSNKMARRYVRESCP